MPRSKKPKDEGNSVPTWIVSFSDMVTLLLAFFVLLQSFASVRDPELFFVGQGSFKQAIASFGLPAWLFGQQDAPKHDNAKVRHPTDEGPEDQPEERVVDAEAEKIRQMFAKLQSEIETEVASLSRHTLRVEAAPITFAAGQADLNDEAKAYLRQFASDLRQAVQARPISLYVIGLAADVPDGRGRWYASARRAEAAQRYLEALLSETGSQCSVISWGAGDGGNWCRQHGLVPEKTSIAIAVVEESVSDG